MFRVRRPESTLLSNNPMGDHVGQGLNPDLTGGTKATLKGGPTKSLNLGFIYEYSALHEVTNKKNTFLSTLLWLWGCGTMKLSEENTNLFYKLMWGLQFYLNQQLQVRLNVHSSQEYAALPMSDKAAVRDALWKNPKLIDAYLDLNPDHLLAEEKEIIYKWKQFIADTFHIFRFLKNYTIFLGKRSQVYGVVQQ